MAQAQSEIRYLTPMSVDVKKKKYCRRITGTSLKFQRRVAQAVKRARHLALLPYVTDLMK